MVPDKACRIESTPLEIDRKENGLLCKSSGSECTHEEDLSWQVVDVKLIKIEQLAWPISYLRMCRSFFTKQATRETSIKCPVLLPKLWSTPLSGRDIIAVGGENSYLHIF